MSDENFSIGDTVIALNYVMFCDGTYHYKNQQFLIDETNIYYFNFNCSDYRKINDV